MPRMAVSAYITFWRPSTLVLHIRKMCWKFWDWNWIDMAGSKTLGTYCYLGMEGVPLERVKA